jgi:5-hydroxyisourate hydrolase-like protein (transthyretin family)
VFKIIDASKNLIGDADLEIEVEYQGKDTIGKYGLEFTNGNFVLTPKETTCLANDHCGIPAEKMKVTLKELQAQTSCCTPNSGCC